MCAIEICVSEDQRAERTVDVKEKEPCFICNGKGKAKTTEGGVNYSEQNYL